MSLSISAVIPAFNADRWLEGTIESVVAQQDGPQEIVVVDDGSTDGTADIARSFDGVTLVSQSNRGVAAARNAGALASSGEVVLFLDADDRLRPGAVASIRRTWERHPDAAAVCPNYIVRTERGAETLAWEADFSERVLRRAQLDFILPRNRLGANSAIRRDVWVQHPFREDWSACEDHEMWLWMLLSGHHIVLLGDAFVLCNVGRPGALSTQTRLMRTQRARLFRELVVRRGLTMRERALVLYLLGRAWVGARLAPAD